MDLGGGDRDVAGQPERLRRVAGVADDGLRQGLRGAFVLVDPDRELGLVDLRRAAGLG
ncbi:MAG: hypothetical protein ACRDQ7_13130 [Haloechinothrix sp.]